MQNYRLKLNYGRLFIIILIVGVLAAISFVIDFSFSEGTMTNETIYSLSKYCFIIIAFPDILAFKFASLQNPLWLGFGFILGCITHGLLIETVISNRNKLFKKFFKSEIENPNSEIS